VDPLPCGTGRQKHVCTGPSGRAFGKISGIRVLEEAGSARGTSPRGESNHLPNPRLQRSFPFRQSEILGFRPLEDPQQVGFCRRIEAGILAGPGARHVQHPHAVLRQPLAYPPIRPGALQPDHQHGTPQSLTATPGQQCSASQLNRTGLAGGENESRIGILGISAGSLGIIAARRFLQKVLGRDHAILGFASFRAPAAMGDSELDSRIECSPVDPGLTTGNDAIDDVGLWGWHGGPIRVSLQGFAVESTPRYFLEMLDAMDRNVTEHPILSVAIIGAGWTGRQIAGQMAAFGIPVTLIDSSAQALEASRSWILSNRTRFVSDGSWPAVDEPSLVHRLGFRASPGNPSELMADGSKAPDLVLESVPEQVALKRRILKSWSAAFPPPTIIASNSSYFTPSTFSEHIVAPERFAHFHFHVPIWKATIVDIASSPRTSDATRARLIDLAHRIGQTPIVNRVENTGYVFNWMLKSVLQSALQLLDRGVATPEEIELAWRKATGMPAGPFGIMDQIGLDVIHQTMSHARFVEGNGAWGPLLDHVESLVDQGHLGVKTGRGFFDYPDGQLPGG
jgi:3-hydroxyacyl-CoA dehydrogenase